MTQQDMAKLMHDNVSHVSLRRLVIVENKVHGGPLHPSAKEARRQIHRNNLDRSATPVRNPPRELVQPEFRKIVSALIQFQVEPLLQRRITHLAPPYTGLRPPQIAQITASPPTPTPRLSARNPSCCAEPPAPSRTSHRHAA